MSYASGFMLGASIGKAIHNMVSGSGRSPLRGRGKQVRQQAVHSAYAAPSVPAMPANPAMPAFACVSSVRGRRRYRAAALIQNQPLAELLQQALGSLSSAQRVEVNAATGSILVYSDNEAALDTVERYLSTHIFPSVPVTADSSVPSLQTKPVVSAYTDVLYEMMDFLNSAVSQKTAHVFDLRSLLSLFLVVRGMRKMIGQNQRPSGPQMLWWATSLMRGRR